MVRGRAAFPGVVGMVSSLSSRSRAALCLFAVAALPRALAAAADFAAPPAWQTYVISESLVMGRDNGAADRPLAVEVGNPDGVLLTGQDLQFPFGGGVRTFYGRRMPDEAGWEIGYFGLYGLASSAGVRTSGDTFLEAPGPLGFDLTSEAQAAFATWNATINSAEVNLFSTDTSRGATESWRTVDWLVGFRYVGVEEAATLSIVSCEGDGPIVPYGVRTSSQLFGGQVGARGRLDWDRWAVEGWAKAAVMGVARTQFQDPVVDWLGEPVPGRETASSASDGVVGFVGDLNCSVVYRLTDAWGIRAGYNTIWIGGTALAPDQWSFSADGAPTNVRGGGGLFLHGVNLGLEARW